ncbi:Winged helix DNA-binding domain-containing protein [Thermomonospora echinospora]|uniref:Winged helix DNA-binding domain-containing protein n=1 Tax=Thermomonospora echinospora TaxID=1992 RepID=A0A1H5XYC4_9ACTN|nr:winged helix DNA-binding domain-containing protein [Thermomonospora echinospora]SEG16632.1 Winged helix DNA-binding domain-containing protein [Thermomonospora echinospora]
MESLTWPQVLAWRMRRQYLHPTGTETAVQVARRLAGVQAQVASAAELAVAVRQAAPDPGETARALWQERTLVKTWAMRGTLHLLPADEAGAYLALCATVRNWEKASWQRNFGASPAELEALAEAATEALAGGACLTREELGAEIVERTRAPHLAEALTSGWGALLKPLAWWGVLCFGPSQGNRVTFCAPSRHVPGWGGLPPAEDAARTVIRAYFGAHGPATVEAFDAWLMRRTHRRKDVRAWFAAMADELVPVEVDGAPMYALAEHLDELIATGPADAVRLLGGFDQYVLGAGTGAAYLIPPGRRAEVSRAAGWISPVVLHRGRVAGIWDAKDGIDPTLWEDVPTALLEPEIARLTRLLGLP